MQLFVHKSAINSLQKREENTPVEINAKTRDNCRKDLQSRWQWAFNDNCFLFMAVCLFCDTTTLTHNRDREGVLPRKQDWGTYNQIDLLSGEQGNPFLLHAEVSEIERFYILSFMQFGAWVPCANVGLCVDSDTHLRFRSNSFVFPLLDSKIDLRFQQIYICLVVFSGVFLAVPSDFQPVSPQKINVTSSSFAYLQSLWIGISSLSCQNSSEQPKTCFIWGC